MGDADFGEIELVSDGEGLALIGPPSAVERFLSTHRLESRELDLPRLRAAFGGGAAVAKAGSEIAANSGRWMKLTEESYQAAKLLPKVTNSTTKDLHAILRAPNGQIAKNLQFLKSSPATLLSNPAMLAGVAGIMAQVAMQQTMDEITDYLAIIDEKVDDVLRTQKDAVLSDMIGVDMALEEAMSIREEVGSVSEVTWSKVQGTSLTIARTQAYALRQLDALAEKLETRSVSDLADSSKKVEQQVQEWLSVLAHCFALQEATGVIELDRVFMSTPAELDQHRVALARSRANRRELISRSTLRLLERMDAAATHANAKVLLNPIESPSIVRSRNHVAESVDGFHGRLSIEGSVETLDARRWSRAVADTRDDILKTGGEGVEKALQFGADTAEFTAKVGAEGVERTKEFAESIADLAQRAFRRRARAEDADE